MARTRRPRHYLPHWVAVAVPAVGFRYDEERHAYVLRRIGNERGPVLRDARLRGRLVRKSRADDDDLDRPQVAMAGAHAEAETGASSTATMVGDHDGALQYSDKGG